MNYSRKQLEAFGEPLGESVTRLKPGGRIYGGGGGGPSSTTVNQSNIPDWLRPQVEQVLGGATKELFKTQQTGTDAEGKPIYDITGTKDFTPYSTDPSKYVAGFSPLQQQVQYNAANLQMPGQYNQATGLAGAAGQGGMQSAQQALGYGNAGFQSGQRGQQLGIQGGQYYGGMGAGYGQQGAGYGQQAADVGQMGLRAEQYGRNVSGQAEDYARQAANAQQRYAAQMTDPTAMQQYMSPYQQNVTDIAVDAARRQADISRTQRGSQAARAGAFGGARQAIENAEAERALQSQLSAIQAQGSQSAYDKAVQSMQYGSNLGLQGLQGAQQGLGTALQGGQLGLSGIGTALQGLQGGMQGAGLGIQGAQAGLQGVDRQLAGTGQGMQGAQVGLQGVSGAQAGYGLANQAASNLSNIGTAQLGAQQGILNLQNQIGGQQQSREQQIINQDIQNFANQQNAPMDSLNQFNALLRGYALPGTTTTQYQAQPTLANQLAGYGTAAVGATALSNAIGKKKGGTVRSGISDLALYNAMH
jgi:hypothetical protein